FGKPRSWVLEMPGKTGGLALFRNSLEEFSGRMHFKPQTACGCGYAVHQNEHRTVLASQEIALLVRNDFRKIIRSPENARCEVNRPRLVQSLCTVRAWHSVRIFHLFFPWRASPAGHLASRRHASASPVPCRRP